MKRAIIYFAWGETHVLEAIESAKTTLFMDIPVVLLTTDDSLGFLPDDHPFAEVLAFPITEEKRIIKTCLWDFIPDGYDSFLFLDVDTRVLLDIRFGFEMAERWGIAVATAPDYSLDNHHGFDRVMAVADMPCLGQNQYNTGVIFFARRPDVETVFRSWKSLAYDLTERAPWRKDDQPFLTLAMEMHGFNPYTLSTNYNYRALIGDHVSGDIRIWHSYAPVPDDVNTYRKPWPPRRFVGDRRFETPELKEWVRRKYEDGT